MRKTATGEKYITFTGNKKPGSDKYRVIMPAPGLKHSAIGRFKTLPEAIKARDAYLRKEKRGK